MKRIAAFMLALVLLLGSFAVPAYADEPGEQKAALLSFASLAGDKADLYYEHNGLQFYRCEFTGTRRELTEFIRKYKLAVTEEGFQWQDLEANLSEYTIHQASITKETGRQALFTVFFQNSTMAAEQAKKRIYTWKIVVTVPEEMITLMLPGLGILVDTKGELIEKTEEGVSYYGYMTDCTLAELSELLYAYERLLQDEGFAWQVFDPDEEQDIVYYAGIARENHQAEIIVSFENYVKRSERAEESICTWVILLAVPEDMKLMEDRNRLAPDQNSFPGPGSLLGVQGTYEEKDEGLLYYTYVHEGTTADLAEFVKAYTALVQEKGFVWKDMETDEMENLVVHASIGRENEPQAEFAVVFNSYVTQAKNSEESICIWISVLAIPESMTLSETVE